MTVTWMWVGGTTDNSSVVTVGTDGTSVRLVVSENEDLSSPVYSAPVAVDNEIAKLTISGLAADTRYHYGVEVDSVVDEMRGQFRTFPTDGEPASFEAVFGACHNTTSDARTFDAIRRRDPAILVHTGDFFYGDLETNVEQDTIDLLVGQLTLSRPGQCYRSVPTAYVPDDHDYGPDNCDVDNPNKTACVAAYQRTVPHYPLVDVTHGLYQTWRIGRVVFVLTDQRHNRTPNDDPDTASKTVFGADQKAWIKATISDAIDNGAPLVVWVFPGVWHCRVGATYDTMQLFAIERRELADWLATEGIAHKVVMVQGDNHMGGITDGRNADYSTHGGGGFPVISASPLHAGWHFRGGPWQQGPYPPLDTPEGAVEQYGVIRVHDTGGDTVTVDMEMWSVDPDTGAEMILGTQVVTTAPPAEEQATPFVYLGGDEWTPATAHVRDGDDWVPSDVAVP